MAAIPAIRIFLQLIYARAAIVWANNAPTWKELRDGFLKPALRYLFIAFCIMMFLWVVFIIIFSVTGALTNSPISGFLFGVLFPVWFLFFILPKGIRTKTRFIAIPIWGRLAQFSLWALTPIVLTAFILLCVGVWSPTIKGSANRQGENVKQELANSLDKNSLKSEKESGIFAKISTKTTAYNMKYQPLHQFAVGDTVLVLDTKALPADKKGEGAVHVMWANSIGDFVDSNTGYIPTRTLDWDWQKSTPVPAPQIVYVPQPTPVVTQETIVQPVSQKEIWILRFTVNDKPFKVTLSGTRTDSEITLSESGENGEVVLHGTLKGNCYVGTMTGSPDGDGTFSFQILPDQQNAIGSWTINETITFKAKRLS